MICRNACSVPGLLAFARGAILLVSSALAASDETILISQASALPPSESPEARIKLRQHREASALNRFTFAGNVLENTGDIVEDWVVMFCPSWHEKCQSLLPSFELLGVQWEDKLNTAVMSSKVRFAKVDCATEKSLCVSLDIDDYPSVVHYKQQNRVNAWLGGAPGLVRWVKEELQPPKRRAKARPSGSDHSKLEKALDQAIEQATNKPVDVDQTCTADVASTGQEGKGKFLWRILRPLAFLFILAIVASYCFSMFSSKRRSEPLEKGDRKAIAADAANPSTGLQERARAGTSVGQSMIL